MSRSNAKRSRSDVELGPGRVADTRALLTASGSDPLGAVVSWAARPVSVTPPENRALRLLTCKFAAFLQQPWGRVGRGGLPVQSVLEVPPALAQPAAGLIGAALPRLAAIARQRADRLLEPPLGLLARALRSLLASASGLGLVDQVLALERILGSAGPIVVRAGPDAGTRSTQGDGRSDKRERERLGQGSGPSPRSSTRSILYRRSTPFRSPRENGSRNSVDGAR